MEEEDMSFCSTQTKPKTSRQGIFDNGAYFQMAEVSAFMLYNSANS